MFHCIQIVTLLLAVLSANAQTKFGPLYTVKDLEALEKQKACQEFLSHARDIRPSQRDKYWKEMVSNMAIECISSANKQKNYTSQKLSFFNQLSKWPSLKQDEVFVARKNEYGLTYLRKCFKKENKKRCKEEMEIFWNTIEYPKRYPELGVNLAIISIKHLPHKDPWPYIKHALTTPFAEFFCKKKRIKKAILQKFSRYLKQQKSYERLKLKALMERSATSECWQQLSPQLKLGLLSPSLELRELSFQLLDAKESLSAKERDVYYTLYLLFGPPLGDTFNLAWSNTKELGQNYRRRQDTLRELSKMDPLPDALFASFDINKKKILTELINDNIPEYIKFYSDTCLKFLSGEGNFPNGNPTVNCRDFFQLVKMSNSLCKDHCENHLKRYNRLILK